MLLSISTISFWTFFSLEAYCDETNFKKVCVIVWCVHSVITNIWYGNILARLDRIHIDVNVPYPSFSLPFGLRPLLPPS